MPEAARKKPSSSTARKVISFILVLFIVTVVGFTLDRYIQIKQYNHIMDEYVNQNRYAEAVPKLEELLVRARFGVKDETRQTLALCYVRLGDDPTLSLARSAEYFRKAEKLDPASLNDSHRQALRAAGAAPPHDE